MRITLAALVLLVTLAHAQTIDRITLYADRAGTDCSIADTRVQEAMAVHMFHEGTFGSGGVEFRAPKPDCWTGATWIGDDVNPAWLSLGTSQGEYLSIAYTYTIGCAIPPVYIGKMLFEVTGTAQACCKYPVLPGIYYQSVVATNCLGFTIPIAGGHAVINENASCPCAPPLAVESTTWGRVKSLYH